MPPHNQVSAVLPLRQALTRSVSEECGGPKAVAFNTTTFDAFKASEGMDRTYKLGRLDAVDLREALNETLTRFSLYHKDTLIVRETGEKGTRLRIFAIRKKSTPRYVHKDHVTRAVHDLYADPVCVIDGDVLA
jgi:hypothetical protein